MRLLDGIVPPQRVRQLARAEEKVQNTPPDGFGCLGRRVE